MNSDPAAGVTTPVVRMIARRLPRRAGCAATGIAISASFAGSAGGVSRPHAAPHNPMRKRRTTREAMA
jgi:hypothetical protein